MTRTADLDRSGSKVANISGGEAESVETGSIVSYRFWSEVGREGGNRGHFSKTGVVIGCQREATRP